MNSNLRKLTLATCALIPMFLAASANAGIAPIKHPTCEVQMFVSTASPSVTLTTTTLQQELLQALLKKGYRVIDKGNWLSFLGDSNEASKFFSTPGILYIVEHPAGADLFMRSDCVVYYEKRYSCDFGMTLKETANAGDQILAEISESLDTNSNIFNWNPATGFYDKVRGQFDSIPECQISN